MVYILQILRACVIGFRCYPILAAVYINTCFSLTCATLYTWFDLGINIVYSGMCHNAFYPSEIDYNKTNINRTITNLQYYGTGSKLLFFQLFTDIPRYLCLAYICIKLPILLFKRVQQRHEIDKQLTCEQKTLLHSSLPYSTEAQYVKKLLGMKHTEVSTNRCFRIFRLIYTWRDDFRFSSRILCVYASIFLLLFFLTLQVNLLTK